MSPSLARLPARLLAGCPTWIALAALLELLSIAGFLVCFALLFGSGMTRRQSVVAGLRALGATTVLPAGGLLGPAIGVRSTTRRREAPIVLARLTVAFVVLTTAPSVAALALFGVSLWLGWPAGPHGALLTLPAAAVAAALLGLVWLMGRPPARGVRAHPTPTWLLRWSADGARAVREGAAESGRALCAGRWGLLGPLAYYAFDNAVLWAAFRAYGSAPPLGVILMGYLVGSVGAALPVPAGLGPVEGGLVGALVLYGAPVAPAAGAVLLYRGVSLGLGVSLSAGAWTFGRPSAIAHSIMQRNNDRTGPTSPSAQVHAGPAGSGRV